MQAKMSKKAKEAVDLAMEQYQELKKTNLFRCYTGMATSAYDFYSEFAHYLNTDLEYLKCAVLAYVTRLFPTHTEITFEPKTEGVSVSPIK